MNPSVILVGVEKRVRVRARGRYIGPMSTYKFKCTE